MKKNKKNIFIALLTTFTLVLSIIDFYIPLPTNIMGVKLGLANIIILSSILLFNFKDTLLIVFMRCILQSLFIGGMSTLFFSLPAGLASFMTMYLLNRHFKKHINTITISLIGSWTHMCTQIIVVIIIMPTFYLVPMIPFMLISSTITGTLIGMITKHLAEHLRRLKLNFIG